MADEERPKLLDDAPRLLGRVLRGLDRVTSFSYSGVRWGVVAQVSGVGSTHAIQICRAFDLDPHERIGDTEWKSLASVFGEENFDESEWRRITGGEDPPPKDER